MLCSQQKRMDRFDAEQFAWMPMLSLCTGIILIGMKVKKLIISVIENVNKLITHPIWIKFWAWVWLNEWISRNEKIIAELSSISRNPQSINWIVFLQLSASCSKMSRNGMSVLNWKCYRTPFTLISPKRRRVGVLCWVNSRFCHLCRSLFNIWSKSHITCELKQIKITEMLCCHRARTGDCPAYFTRLSVCGQFTNQRLAFQWD